MVVEADDIRHLHLVVSQGAGFIEHHRIDIRQLLNRSPTFQQQTVLRSPVHNRFKSDWRTELQRTGIVHEEDGGQTLPATGHGKHRRAHAKRDANATVGHGLSNLLSFTKLGQRIADKAANMRRRGRLPNLLGGNRDVSVLDLRSRIDPGARFTTYRHAFPGHRRLIDLSNTAQHRAVGRDIISRTKQHHIARHQLAAVDLHAFAIALNPYRVLARLHQVGQQRIRVTAGLLFHVLTERQQRLRQHGGTVIPA